MTRLVVETGGIMTGGAAQVGKLCVAMATRSVTSCRAASSSAPCFRIARTDESCGTELDRRISTPGTPFIAFSIGTVTCSSTSAGDKSKTEGLHLDSWRRELRKDVDRNVLQPLRSEIDQAKTKRYNNKPEPQACSNDPPDHGLIRPLCRFIRRSRQLPSRTVRALPPSRPWVPAGGPSER
jgi:hypothetical protein